MHGWWWFQLDRQSDLSGMTLTQQPYARGLLRWLMILLWSWRLLFYARKSLSKRSWIAIQWFIFVVCLARRLCRLSNEPIENSALLTNSTRTTLDCDHSNVLLAHYFLVYSPYSVFLQSCSLIPFSWYKRSASCHPLRNYSSISRHNNISMCQQCLRAR